MPFEHWLAFATASAILVAIPGPTVLLVISYALSHGRKSPVATVLGFSPLPLLADAPGDVPRGETLDERVLALCFVDEAPDGCWDDVFALLGRAAGDAGIGTVIWSSAFVSTVPGTDRYTDQLWSDQ